MTSATGKTGRPRKDPRGTQREIRDAERARRRALQENAEVYMKNLQDSVQFTVRSTIQELDWFQRLLTNVFASSIISVEATHPREDKKVLAKLTAEAFTRVLGECSDLVNLINGYRPPGDDIDGIDSIGEQVSDEEAAEHGWLPDA